MKSIPVFITLTLVVYLPVCAQETTHIDESGNFVTESRNLSDYDEIEVNGNINVILTEGKKGEVTIKGDENFIKEIETTVKNNRLSIKSIGHRQIKSSKGKNILISVPFQKIRKIERNGSGDLVIKNTIKSEKIKLKLNGSGKIKLDIEAVNLHAKVNGSGKIYLSGITDYFDAKVMGSGSIDAQKLSTKNCRGDIIGSGNIAFDVEKNLDAKIFGSGNISLNKPVFKIKKEIIGTGKINEK